MNLSIRYPATAGRTGPRKFQDARAPPPTKQEVQERLTASADYTTVKESFPELAFLGYLTPEEWCKRQRAADMPYRQRNNVFYPASAIILQKQRAKRQAAGYGSGSLDAFTEEERRSVQVAEGVLPDHIRKKMHELLGEEETPRAEISDGAKRQGRAMEEWWARQEARSTRAVRPAEPAIAAAAQATAKSLAAKAAEGLARGEDPWKLPGRRRRDPVWETEFTDTPPWRA